MKKTINHLHTEWLKTKWVCFLTFNLIYLKIARISQLLSIRAFFEQMKLNAKKLAHFVFDGPPCVNNLNFESKEKRSVEITLR